MAWTTPAAPAYGCGPIRAILRYYRYMLHPAGRASLSEWWWTQAWLTAVAVAVWLAAGIWAMTAVSLAHLPATLSLMARRLHDRDLSGLWVFAWWIPSVASTIPATLWAGSWLGEWLARPLSAALAVMPFIVCGTHGRSEESATQGGPS